MNKKTAKACWEFMECPKEIKENCEVYKRDLGQECWLVVKDILMGCCGYNNKDGCRNCPWFIENYGPAW